LPGGPGAYVLFFLLESDRTLAVGRLGVFHLPSGIYAYVGSALGPGGLAARVGRHLRGRGAVHWHVDYLRAQVAPTAVWLAEGNGRRECIWAAVLARTGGASLPAPGFGASDCRCPAHLIHLPALPDLAAFARQTGDPVSSFRGCFESV
jgi:Uri superfamily endonuclease